MKKRGQITVFIIIGIALLLSTAVILYFTTIKKEISIAPKEIISPEVIPVKTFVESCLSITSESAIRTIGMQAGYLEIPADIRRSRYSYIRLDPGAGYITPFWYYQENSYVPSLSYIERNLEEYITASMDRCLENFTAFEEQYVITKKGNLTADVIIGEENIVAKIDMPLEIQVKGKEKTVEHREFLTTLPVKFKRVYQLAAEIMDAENIDMFMEDITIDLMAMDPKIPFTGMTFHCGDLFWLVGDVRQEIRRILEDTVFRIRFKNTNYVPFLEDEKAYEKFRNLEKDEEGIIKELPKDTPPADIYEYFHYFIDFTENDYSDLEVSAIYRPEFGLGLTATPSDNAIMRSSVARGMSEFLKIICVNIYHFTYDVYYPVQIMISEPAAFNGQGYIFSFAFPVIIKNNEGSRRAVAAKIFEAPEIATGFCDNLGEEKVEIKARDSVLYSDLNNINISYECFGFRCLLGKTHPIGGVYSLITGIPAACSGGNIEAEGENYLGKKMQYSGGDYLEMLMTPLKRFNFTVFKLRSNYLLERENLEDDETAIIRLKNYEYPDYDVFAEYPVKGKAMESLESLGFQTGIPGLETVETIPLIKDGTTYKAEMYLLKGDRIIGGYDGNWSPSYEEILENSMVEFTVIEQIPWPDSQMKEALLLYELQNMSIPLTHYFVKQ